MYDLSITKMKDSEYRMKTTYRVLYMIGFIFNILCFFYVLIAMILVKAMPDTLIKDGAADNIEQLNIVFFIFLGMTLLQLFLLVFHVLVLFLKAKEIKLIYPILILAILNINLISLVGSILNLVSESKHEKSSSR